MNSGRCNRTLTRGVIVLLVFMPLALGSVHMWSSSLSLTVVFLMTAVFLARRVLDGGLVIPAVPAWPFLGLIFLVASVQILPMPLRVLEVISPEKASLGQAAAVPFAVGGLHSLSLYPRATIGAVLKLSAFVALFLLVTNLFRTDRALKKLALAIACTGFAVALVGLLQHAAGTDGIYGFWRSRYWKAGEGSFFGSFVNKNHFAGYMEMSIPLTLALGVGRRSRRRVKTLSRRFVDAESGIFRTLFVLFCASVMFWALLCSGSIGGIASLALAAAIVVLTPALRRGSWKFRFFAIVGVLLACAGISAYVGDASPLAFAGIDSSRAHVWQDSLTMGSKHPWMGTGLGTFEHVFPVYSTLHDGVTYRHAHNEYVQFFAEMGIFGLIGLAGVFVVLAFLSLSSLRRNIRLRSSSLAIASLTGALSLTLHGIVDFNFHITANALTLAVVAGIALNSMLPFSDSPSPFREIQIDLSERLPKRCCIAGISFCILLSLLAASAATAGMYRSRAESIVAERGGRPETALDHLKKARRFDPLNSKYAYMRGRIYEMLAMRERWDEASRERLFNLATKEYARATTLEPTSALYHLSVAYALAGGDPAATTPAVEKEFEVARLLDPSSPKVSEYIAQWSRIRDGAPDKWGKAHGIDTGLPRS